MARGIVWAGIADLLAERGDAGIAGEGEEQQACGLEDPAETAVGERPDVRRCPDRQ